MNELVPVPVNELSTDFEAQVDRAKKMRDDAQAGATKVRYAPAVRDFLAWCNGHGIDGCNPQVVATYLMAMFDNGSRLSTIDVARAAIIDFYRASGEAFDHEDEDLRRVMAGIRRNSKKSQKSMAALEAADIRAILALPSADVQTTRDKAMIALAFGHALRGPSELLRLDYGQLGDGNGWIEITSTGVVITLESSKASQEAAETLVCDVASVRKAVSDWIIAGGIENGTPLFRRLRKGMKVTTARLGDQGMQDAIRRIVANLMRSRGMSETEASMVAKRFGTHSMRKGVLTSLARDGRSVFELQQVSRHKSLSSLQKYVVLGGQATKPVAALID